MLLDPPVVQLSWTPFRPQPVDQRGEVILALPFTVVLTLLLSSLFSAAFTAAPCSLLLCAVLCCSVLSAAPCSLLLCAALCCSVLLAAPYSVLCTLYSVLWLFGHRLRKR